MLNSFVVAALLVAVPLGAAPPSKAASLDAAHAAVASILASDRDADSCTPDQQLAMASGATIKRLGRTGGDDVVLAAVFNPCICGAQNCPYYVLRLTPGRPRRLLSTFGVTVKTLSDLPLPRIVIRAHDSAAVADESTYAFRNGTYALIDDVRVRWADNARKPNALPVHFALNASSAPLRGRVSLGWYDTYQFGASRGQVLTIGDVRSPARVTLTLYDPAQKATQLAAGKPFALRANGTYRLQVEGNAEQDAPYALTLAIR